MHNAVNPDAEGRLTLYDLDHSPFAARVRIVAHVKRLAITIVRPPGGVRSDAYRRINPLGLVPTLVTEDGTAIPESEIIVEYLDERFPEPRLFPDDVDQRARCRLLSRIGDLYLAPALKELFERTKTATDPAVAKSLAAPVREHLETLDGLLLDEGPYAVGAAFTAADCALAPLLFFVERCAPLVQETPLLGRPRVVAYWNEVRRHPSVQHVLAEMAAAQNRRAAARARGEPED